MMLPLERKNLAPYLSRKQRNLYIIRSRNQARESDYKWYVTETQIAPFTIPKYIPNPNTKKVVFQTMKEWKIEYQKTYNKEWTDINYK